MMGIDKWRRPSVGLIVGVAGFSRRVRSPVVVVCCRLPSSWVRQRISPLSFELLPMWKK